MIYITQLVYLKPGEETLFDQFEKLAIPIISKYKGRLLFRLRPAKEQFIESHIDPPYEIHLVAFEREEDFHDFSRDEERKQFLYLKEQSIASVLLIKGEKI